jgi:phosphoesterase RecJ-like protein
VQTPVALLNALCQSGRVLLTGPVAPDGDSIGACLALQRILESRGVIADVAGTPNYRYAWIPDANRMVPDARIRPDYTAVVVLDGDRHRLTPPALAAFEAASVKAIIDHHASTVPEGYTHWWLDGKAASTCEMLFRRLGDWSIELDADLAAQLYTGAIFDTGGFRYSNTTPATMKMAAALIATGIEHAAICTRVLMERRESRLRLAGHVFSPTTFHSGGQLAVGLATADLKHRFDCIDGDLEGIVDQLVHVHGVQVAALLVQRDGDEIKYSLRSRGKIDVAKVARELSPKGGGHSKAAGASVFCPVEEAARRAVEVISARLAEADARSA